MITLIYAGWKHFNFFIMKDQHKRPFIYKLGFFLLCIHWEKFDRFVEGLKYSLNFFRLTPVYIMVTAIDCDRQRAVWTMRYSTFLQAHNGIKSIKEGWEEGPVHIEEIDAETYYAEHGRALRSIE